MMADEVKTIVVCGAGTMGSGIAQVAATAGYNTILYDVQEATLATARSSVHESLQYLLHKKKINDDEAEAILSRLHFTIHLSHCIGEVVIEAIVERLDAKLSLFSALAGINSEDCILATNTSSLSVSAIQKELPQPQRVAGMHFFNPAPVMKLVEIVKGEKTSDATVQLLYDLANTMGKKPVHCLDAPGFIVNHVARPYYLTALRMVENEVATPETVDAALEAAGFKMGPFTLMDLIGIDINYSASQQVWEALGQPKRLQPSALQKEKVDAGQLGRKTNQGFYTY